ncbi:MAG: hypothetical protein MZV70_13575 [Desulfobacterales bacterium]|nr:hypothetical protein [Desulfobacterales bacterium]
MKRSRRATLSRRGGLYEAKRNGRLRGGIRFPCRKGAGGRRRRKRWPGGLGEARSSSTPYRGRRKRNADHFPGRGGGDPRCTISPTLTYKIERIRHRSRKVPDEAEQCPADNQASGSAGHHHDRGGQGEREDLDVRKSRDYTDGARLDRFLIPRASIRWIVYYEDAFQGKVIDTDTKGPIEGAVVVECVKILGQETPSALDTIPETAHPQASGNASCFLSKACIRSGGLQRRSGHRQG